MTHHRPSLCRRVLPALFIATLPTAALATAQSLEYVELTNTYKTVTNFNVETTRGMSFSTAGMLAGINTHGSQLCVFFPGSLTPDVVVPTLNNPIAVDFYLPPTAAPGKEIAVVLCAGTHAVATHDTATGRILEVLQLPAETGDLVVDSENDRCFISIPGNNTCVQVRLPSLEIDAVFNVASQRPRFLSFDPGAADSIDDNRVFVAPETSGNNTISNTALLDGFLVAGGSVGFPDANVLAIDLDNWVFQTDGLPDEDLFLLPPQPTPSGVAPTVDAVAMLRRVGTLLMAHGRNPVTGDYWMVGTESLNTSGVNEPEIKGNFAVNLATISPTLGTGAPVPFNTLPQPSTFVDLDFVGGSYQAQHAISMPYALEFHPTGAALIAGSASDRIRILNTTGARIGDQDLPPGSIPRQIWTSDDGLVHLVYCWGTNVILAFDSSAVLQAMAADPNIIAPVGAGLIATFDLGVDPTPPTVARGRELFYDSSHSADSRFTCAHCHPGGGMDLLGWNLADFPHDHKDLMVTQSLRSIEDTFPYHWRGENDLEAFNSAFEGLLGGVRLTEDVTDPAIVAAGLSTDTNGIEFDEPSEFEDFKAFIFSLQVHANPHESIERRLDPNNTVDQDFLDPALMGATSTGGNPAVGQALMFKPGTLGAFSCADCHGLPNGAVGDPQVDDAGLVAGNLHLDVAHFRQLFHKEQPLVPISATDGSVTATWSVPRSGYGLSHDGNHTSIADFLLRNPFTLDTAQNEEADLAAFVQQADEGIAPAAHAVFQFDRTSRDSDLGFVRNTLIPQTGKDLRYEHWIDLAIVGQHRNAAGIMVDLRWSFDQLTSRFIPSDRTVTFANGTTGAQSWSQLGAAAQAGDAEFVLIGVPPGDGERWAIDRDDDGLDDTDEAAQFTDALAADTDGDGDPDGHEALNMGAPTNPAIQANDTTPASVVFARIDHTASTYIKLALEFTEPVTYEVIATGTLSGAVTERRFEFVTVDSVAVQRLTPSIPALTTNPAVVEPIPSVARIPNPYQFQINMTDLAGNTSSTVLTQSAETRDQLVLTPFVPGTPNTGPIPPPFLSRILTNLAWTQTPNGTTFSATAQVKARFDAPEVQAAYTGPTTPNGSASPEDQQVVAFQVIRVDAAGNRTVLSNTTGSPTYSTTTGSIFQDITFDTATPVNVGIDGPFLLAPATGPNGTATVDFSLSSPLPAGESICLNVIGIYEQDTSTTPAPPLNLMSPVSNASYNKPVTEAQYRALLFP